MSLKVIQFPGLLVNYKSSLELQQKLVAQKLLNRHNEPDYLLLLEHEPIITLGRRCKIEVELEAGSIRGSHPIIKSNRGGRITYHGPGQLTCYPILDLKRQPKLSLECYVKNLAAVMKSTLARSFPALPDTFYDERTERVGLWLPDNKKIGFIGIQAQKWIVSHGFSINIDGRCLQGFDGIDPCGLREQKVNIVCAEDESKQHKPISGIHDILIDSFKKQFYHQ